MSGRTDAGGTGPVYLAGAFGTGNLGNDASLRAVASVLTREAPGLDLVVLTYGDPEGQLPAGLPHRPWLSADGGGGRGPRTGALRRAADKAADLALLVRRLRGARAVVVPGMGVFEERLAGGPWGFPLALATLAVAARATGSPLHLVGVGVDLPTAAATRRLFALAAGLATTRSFRDEAARLAMAALGVDAGADPVVPDVVFVRGNAGMANQPRPPGTVGVGVLRYYGPADDPDRGAGAHAIYVARMAQVVVGLLDEGLQVTLLVGDGVDAEVFPAIRAAVRSDRPDVEDRLRERVTATFEDLLEEVEGVEVLVASRYHNIVAGVLARRPVVSVGYGPKNRALLDDLGLGRFSQEIDDLDPEILLAQVREARRDAAVIGERLAQEETRCRTAIDHHLTDLARRLAGDRTARADAPTDRLAGRSPR